MIYDKDGKKINVGETVEITGELLAAELKKDGVHVTVLIAKPIAATTAPTPPDPDPGGPHGK